MQLKGGETSQWFAGLPRGARCWASESNSLGAASVTISNDTGNPVTLTDADPDATVTVDNNYPTGGNEIGSLVITKNLTGEAAIWAQGPFEFETKCSVGGYVIPSVTPVLTPTNREDAIKNLPVGASCVIQEKTVGSASMPQPNVVGFATVPDVSTQDVSVDPAYAPAVNDFPAGYITLEKSTDGAAAESMSGARFVLNVRCERDLIAGGTEEILAREVTLRAGESVRLDNDPMPVDARCWATEIDSSGATAVSVNHGPANPLTIQVGEPEVTIRAVNTFDAGSIQLVKTLSGEAAKYGEGPFDFTISCTLGGVDVPQQTVSLTPKNLQATVSGLPVGAVCAIHEVSAGNASVTLPRLVATVTVPSATGTPVVVEVDNPFPAGRLTVSKEVRGAAADLTKRARFRIRVICEFRGERVLRETFTLRAGKSKTLADPLPMGTLCWGKELGDTGAGKSSVSPSKLSAAIPVSEEEPAVTVTATNKFKAGNLRVRRKVQGGAVPDKADYGFKTACVAGKGRDRWRVDLPRRHKRFTVRASKTQKVVVPAGSKCTVKETKDWQAKKTTYSKRGGKPSTKRGKVTVKGKKGLVVVTNTFSDSHHGKG